MKSEKNNSLIIIIIVLVLIVMGMGGYIVYNKLQENNDDIGEKQEEEDNNTDVTTSIKIDETNDYVYTATYEGKNTLTEFTFREDGVTSTITDFDITYVRDGKQYASDLIVPYINIDTEEVAEINNQLKELYEEYTERFDSCIGTEDMSEGCSEVLTYLTYQYNDVLSIVVVYGWQSTNTLTPDYYTYNFDLTTGKLLNYSELLNTLNYTTESIEDKVEDAINTFIDNNSDYKEYANELYLYRNNQSQTSYAASYDEYLENVQNDTVLSFINESGNLNIITKLFIPAGNMYQYHKITVE